MLAGGPEPADGGRLNVIRYVYFPLSLLCSNAELLAFILG
jgi:hypothetical protein